MKTKIFKLKKASLCAVPLLVITLLASSQALALQELKLGGGPYFSYAPVFIALECGYLDKSGLKVNSKFSRASGPEMVAALVAGEFDIVGAGVSAGIFNAVLRGIKVKIVADKGNNKGKQSFGWLVARKELYDSGQITKIEDIKGKNVGYPGVGSSSWIALGLMLESKGLTFNDIKLLKMRTPDIVKALKAGTIDAATIAEPFISRAKALGVVAEIAGNGEVMGEFLQATLVTTDDMIQKKRKELEIFLQAYAAAIRDYTANPHKPEFIQAIKKYTKLDEKIIKNCYLPYFAPNGRVTPSVLEKQMEFLVKHGYVKKKIPLEQIVDNSLLPK